MRDFGTNTRKPGRVRQDLKIRALLVPLSNKNNNSISRRGMARPLPELQGCPSVPEDQEAQSDPGFKKTF